eukprot:2664827-Pleurochrysis_carterae.AAC.4
MRDSPDSRARPQPFVRGLACFVPIAGGCVWDLRGPVIMPLLNFTACPASPLNLPYIEASLPEWPDARLLGYLAHVVRFEVDIPLQIALFPHFISFPNGFSSLQKEVRRMQTRDWFDIFSALPYLPIRMICPKATPHKFEPDRWRSTTDAGAPRNHLADDSGVVPSINDLSRQFSRPLEQKPTPRDLANDLAILNQHAVRLASDDVFLITDDVADYFPHISLAPTEYWFSTLATLLLPGDMGCSRDDRLAFVAELSTILLALLRVEFRRFVGQHNFAALAWFQAREHHLGVDDAHMHTALMYIDDIVLAAVGSDRIAALLRARHRVTRNLGLTIAIPEKRQAGTSVLRLGMIFVAAPGVLFLPRDKDLRAVDRIQCTLARATDTATLRTPCGLLEHVRGSG